MSALLKAKMDHELQLRNLALIATSPFTSFSFRAILWCFFLIVLLTALSLPWEVPQAAQHRQHPAPCCAGVAAPHRPLPPNQGSVSEGNTSLPCHACDTTLTASHCCCGADFGPPHSCWSPQVPLSLLSRQGRTQNLSWTRQSQRKRRAEGSSLLTPNKNISFLPTSWRQGCVHTR